MNTLHGRRKRRFRTALWVAAALLLAAAAAILLWRPFRANPPAVESSPSPTLVWSATPALAASPSPEPSPSPSPTPDETPFVEAALSSYEAVLWVDTEQSYVFGRLRLTYVNRYRESLFSVVLNLIPNAVQENCLSLETVTVGGLTVDYSLDNGGAYLTLPLPRELKPGESADIYLSYNLRVPKTNDRFGAGDNRFMFGNAIPIAAEYENGAWRMDGYYGTGDSFYSAVADYRVSIAAPQSYTLACTGAIAESRTEGGVTTSLAVANSVREFAFSLHKSAYTATQTVNGVEVLGVARTKKAADLAAAEGAAALAYYAERLGAYPYPRFCVVDFNGGGGMEYPGLVMIDTALLNGRDENYAAMVVAHETAHQWFYGIVGSDQLNEPWADESLVEFLGFDFIRAVKGVEAHRALWASAFEGLADYTRTLRLDAPLKSFQGSDYFYVIYAYGAHVMKELYDKLGADLFYEALQHYVAQYSFRIAKASDLIAAFSAAAGRDMTAWFAARM